MCSAKSFSRAGALLYIGWCTAVLADATPLTLEDAVERAIHVSPEVETQAAARDAAQSLVVSAGQLPDPELVVGVDNLPITGADAGSLTRDFMTMRKIGLMQSLPRKAKRDLRTQRAGDADRLAAAEQVSTTLEVKRQTAQAWIATSIAEEMLSRLKTLDADFELQTQLAGAGVQSGRTTVADALGSQAALLSFRDRMQIAEQNVRRARAELTRWLPDDAARSLGAAPNFALLPKIALLSNIHRHAALVAYDAKLDEARSEVKLAQAETHPDWSVGVTYAKRGPDFSDMVSMEMRIGLPLFARTRQNPVIAAKRAELRKVEAERESELRMHTATVTQLIADWETLRTRHDTFNEKILPLAKERTQLAIESLRSGRGAVKAALNAQLSNVELQLQALEVEAQLGRTWAALNYLQAEGSGS